MLEDWELPNPSETHTIASPSTNSKNRDEEINHRLRTLPLFIVDGSKEILRRHLEMAPTTNNADYQELTLPTFDRAGSYNSTIPASRWLLRLKYDFRRAGYNPPP
ncbi:hypothetical protein Golomagni_04727, partial [Golovinomyces magnicellulatus]